MKLPSSEEEELSHGSRRPPPLKVKKHSLKKTRLHDRPPATTFHRRRSPAPVVITYLRSPKVHLVEPRNFMRVVQQLTGNDYSSSSRSSSETNRVHGADEACSTMISSAKRNPDGDQDAGTEEKIKWYINGWSSIPWGSSERFEAWRGLIARI
ncbi:hypothetical protein H6P81_005176 [Aristolochia fimbriata]|uniref:VQ domain-containing protein n=1 Tax=Aristolochia fimbriata TaxID=158543 RepID=A0AAV7ETU2_ARIFI|nr:hypothetical protein H6P81_005176 [Aristolochia fimbriata]